MNEFILLVIGYIIGFVFCRIFYGKTEGDCGIIPNCRIPIGKHIIYLHH